MDSQFFFTVWILTAIGLCLCQNKQIKGPLNGEVGGSVEFRLVNPPSVPPDQFTWSFGFVTICTAIAGTVAIVPSYRDRVSVDGTTATLVLRDLTFEDTGQYILNTVIGETENSMNTELTVLERISSVTLEANQTELVEFNNSVTLTCSASGSSPSFRWFNNSAEVTGSDRVLIDKGTLTVLSVTRYDNGPYRCNASNIVSFNMSSDVLLTIAYGPDSPVVTVTPQAPFYGSGSNISLSCSSESSPAAQLQWALKDTLLDEKGPELRLDPALTSDSGDYSCWAYNSKTQRYKLSSPTSITVFEKVSNAAITIAGSPDPLIAGKSSVNLTCEAKGSVITRKWMKNEETLSPSNRTTFRDNNRTVSISPVQKEDRGEYKCQVSNPISSTTGCETLIVNYGPEAVHIQGKGAIEFGHQIHLSCSAESVPDCTYTWTLNGTDEIGTGASFIKENSVYEDSGIYTCTAFNNITKETNKTDFNMSVKAPGSLGGQGGLSAGPIAGIVIGVLVLLAAGGGGIYILTYILKNKRKKDLSTIRQQQQPGQSGGDSVELNHTHTNQSHRKGGPGGNVGNGANASTGPNQGGELNYAAITDFHRRGGPGGIVGNGGNMDTQYAAVRHPSSSGPNQGEDVNYADISEFQKRDGQRVNLRTGGNVAQYAAVQKPAQSNVVGPRPGQGNQGNVHTDYTSVRPPPAYGHKSQAPAPPSSWSQEPSVTYGQVKRNY